MPKIGTVYKRTMPQTTCGAGVFKPQYQLLLIATGNVNAFSKKDGLWTDYTEVDRLGITNFDVNVYAETECYSNSGIYLYVFPKKYTRKLINQIGLIYTDSEFEESIQGLLKANFFNGTNSVSYTEQGMQGDTMVSMEAGKEFLKDLMRKFPGKIDVQI